MDPMGVNRLHPRAALVADAFQLERLQAKLLVNMDGQRSHSFCIVSWFSDLQLQRRPIGVQP